MRGQKEAVKCFRKVGQLSVGDLYSLVATGLKLWGLGANEVRSYSNSKAKSSFQNASIGEHDTNLKKENKILGSWIRFL